MTPSEKELVGRLLERPFPGRDELRQQLKTAKVRVIDEDGGLEISVSSSTRAGHVKYRIPVEAEYEDADGSTVHVLLHVVGGRANELEFYREDNSSVKSWPDPGLLRVFAPGAGL
jgi:hypothetical protein